MTTLMEHNTPSPLQISSRWSSYTQNGSGNLIYPVSHSLSVTRPGLFLGLTL